ncbi:hypothetical protein PG997_014189 [Apiospora hydei]|uniref:Transcription factor domain-containing protein n=1 Tax=Apiospora hydei TaxID=1337664 RepID=A0ABR1UTR9_9PEZI
MSMLKSRKRSSCQNAEEKWFEIWAILFPHLDRPESAYNREANLRTPSAANSALDCESLGTWWDQLADHLAMRLRDSLLPVGTLPSEQDPHLLRNHIASALRDYPGLFPTIPNSSDGTTTKQPKMEDIADLQGPSPHGSSGSCLSFSTTDGFSDGDAWMLGSPQTPSMPDFTFDPRVNMGTAPGVKFMSIDWSNSHGSPVPRYVPVVPMDGAGFLPWEELQGPLETLHIGSDAMTTSDTGQVPHEWYDINEYPDMWNLLNNDTSGRMGIDEAHGNV